MKKYLIVTFFMLGLFYSVMSFSVVAKTTIKKTATVSVTTSVNKKKSMTIYFKNLQGTSSVNYELSYLTNGIPQGAGGTINSKGKYSLSRTLLFGTCSNKVCRYHQNIKNAKVSVTIVYKNGQRNTKVYKLKV